MRDAEVLHEEPRDPRVRTEAPVDGARDVIDLGLPTHLETSDVESTPERIVQALRRHLFMADHPDEATADLGREMLARAGRSSDETDRRTMGPEEGPRDRTRSTD